MPDVTLSDIRDAAERRFGDYVIALDNGEAATLQSPLRLSDDASASLRSLQSTLDDTTADPSAVRDAMSEVVRLVAKTPDDADRLLGQLSDDLPTLVMVIDGWGKSTLAGEA
jgi:hypothetical protein